ncbi:aminoacyl-tRNA hydrolase [Ruicaihuangia caeni]|uniref:aminoacyl-tRNA hydrolase n=1 Tax=Ruicaihuangia caeni TaxID=3042517 RepID=UPI00338F69FB
MTDESPWLIAGLGNPGPGYAGNRHNVGHMVAAELASRVGGAFRSHKANAMVVEGRAVPGGPKLIVATPNTFMNVSGTPVASLLRFFKLAPERLIVIHDDLDLPFDTVRLKHGGGHGGQNGLRDIIRAVGTPEFTRVRVGIGRPPGRQAPADYVLSDFSSVERRTLPNVIADAADAVEHITARGLLDAQQRFHAPRE